MFSTIETISNPPITFSTSTCYEPKVVFEESYLSTAPSLIYRSNLFSVSTVISFYCNCNFTYQNKWTLTQVDPQTLKILKLIDLTKNPTSKLSELVIKENSLAYGLYKFRYHVEVTFNGISQIASNVAETFIQIIPTGLAVFAIKNGVSSVLLGSLQSFNLQPSVFSMDYDNVTQPNKLKFVYYCRTVNQSDTSSFTSSSNQIDLFTYKYNSSLIMNKRLNCFGNSSNFTLL